MPSADSGAPGDAAARIAARPLVAAGGAALLAGLVYLNALHNPFVYDDYHTVVANASIQSVIDLRTIVLGALTRPLVNLSYAVDRAVSGATPLGFHVTNVLLHMLNVVLLFQLAWRFERDRNVDAVSASRPPTELGAFAAAALFAVHPMMTEAVGYISGRSEVLCATFFLTALLCGRRWLRGDGARFGLFTVGLWIAALATKETAAMFPFVLLAYDWFAMPAGAERRRRILMVHLPLIATAVAGGLLRLVILARVEYPGQVSFHWTYLLMDLDVVRRYIWLMLAPSGQTIFHAVTAVSVFSPRALLAVVVVGLMAALVWRLRRVEWLAGFGILWFLLLLVPSSVLAVLDQGEPMAEHRVYLASGGLFLAAGAAIWRLGGWLAHAGARPRAMAGATLVLILGSFAAQTVLRNEVWNDPVALWRESVDLAPDHYRPRLLLGEALQDAGRRQEAIEQYQTAVKLRPAEPTGYVKLGQCLAEVGRLYEARLFFLKATELDPGNSSARQALRILDQIESRPGAHVSRR